MRWCFTNLAIWPMLQEHWSEASTYFRQSLLLFHQAAKLSGIADCAVGLARVAVESGQPARAAQLIGFAEASRAALNTQDEFVTPSKLGSV